MEKIAIITANDSIWALSVWRRAVPVLQDAGYQIKGIWLTDDRLAQHKGLRIHLYYLRTFGLINFTLLAAFAVFTRLAGLVQGRQISISKLAENYSLPIFKTSSPNQEAVVGWLKENEIDIAIIMTPFIIKSPFINAVKKGVINKHAALLPANKGLFPYFWARLKGEPQGISFHLVNEGIDTGATLWQLPVEDKKVLSSMISFYTYVFQEYVEGLMGAIHAISGNKTVPHLPVTPSYHGLPCRKDYLEFKKKGGAIISFKDIFLGWRH